MLLHEESYQSHAQERQISKYVIYIYIKYMHMVPATSPHPLKMCTSWSNLK